MSSYAEIQRIWDSVTQTGGNIEQSSVLEHHWIESSRFIWYQKVIDLSIDQ